MSLAHPEVKDYQINEIIPMIKNDNLSIVSKPSIFLITKIKKVENGIIDTKLPVPPSEVKQIYNYLNNDNLKKEDNEEKEEKKEKEESNEINYNKVNILTHIPEKENEANNINKVKKILSGNYKKDENIIVLEEHSKSILDGDDFNKELLWPLQDKFRLLTPEQHPHAHVSYCGHPRIIYENKIEYIHDMELHSEIENGFFNIGYILAHVLEINSINQDVCKPLPNSFAHNSAQGFNYEVELKLHLDKEKLLGHDLMKEEINSNMNLKSIITIESCSPFVFECNDNSFETFVNQLQKKVELDHNHSPICGHIPLKHGNHIDYIVNGYLHHPHDNHCDFHGEVNMISE